MARLAIAVLLVTLLGGCIVLPLDYGYPPGPHRHRHPYWSDRQDDDGYRAWRYRH